MTPDGRYVVFHSIASNLVPGVASQQVYRKDLQTGQIRLCSANAAGTQGDNASYYPVISSDGRYVAFYSQATNLVTPATVNMQVFRKDLETGEIELASANAGGTPGDGGAVYIPDITPDGRFVCFTSTSTNLVTPATAGQELFRKDMDTGEIKLVSSDAAGVE
jgi:Tol biopolymer transport system component